LLKFVILHVIFGCYVAFILKVLLRLV